MIKDLFRQTVAAGLKRKAITTCSKWARTYRIMGPPHPGPWTPGPAPWTVDMHDYTAPKNIGQKSAQMGYTETALNITLYKIDMESLDCLYVLPAKTPDASEFSAARFDPAIELSPRLTELFSSVKNVGHKRAGAINLYIRGCKSRSALKSIPVAFIVFDEIDEMNTDLIPLAEERTSGRVDPQIWKISTPTLPNKGINELFLDSTQEHYEFKCPHCSRIIELIWPDAIKIIGDHHNNCSGSHLQCPKCSHKLEHETKQTWLAGGQWTSYGDTSLDARGFYINQLYSITRRPEEVTKLYFKGLIDKASEQEFFNSKLGLPHIVKGAQVQKHEVERARGGRRKDDPIPENKIITMGVDQGRWLYYEVVAWDFDELGNDLNMSAKANVLAEGKVVDFSELDLLMRQYQVIKCVIDAQPDRRKAYEFACKYWGHVLLCFYARGQMGKTITIDPSAEQHKIAVDRTSWLDVALNRFRLKTITLPQDLSEEYPEHISNLVKHYTTDKSGNPMGEYKNMGPDHLGHARCYSEIALPLAAALTTNKNVRVFL